MDVLTSASLGLAFLVSGVAAVFLMFRLWGYPYDKATHTSAAPPGLMRLHRILGWIYVILYIVMMSEMVPRLWNYQVEFPPRTVAHLMLGMSIGIILLIKISILRFFRHFEEWMPVLGTLLLACTILLSGLSLPFAMREFVLSRGTDGGNIYKPENLERLARVLPDAGLPEEAPLEELATPRALRNGRTVLVRKCVVCHDLKTILTRPRSPSNWVQTVQRMAEKPTFAAPITQSEQWTTAVYLIAISPDLQQSVKMQRQQRREAQEAQEAMVASMEATGPGETAGPDDATKEKAKATYEKVCSQCHELSDVDANPPKTAKDVDAVIRRMIEDNGMEASKEELDLVRVHMVAAFVEGAAAGGSGG
ncbi:MAG: hypothetical protein R3A51_15900 [Nannocystaceae bacterium]